jgi:hypothetical protein
MVQCRLPDGTVIGVGGCPECDALNGGCLRDHAGGLGPSISFCFVRNVLVRTLADTLVDVSSSVGVTATFTENLNIVFSDEQPQNTQFILLSDDMRRDMAGQITNQILELAATYLTTVDFRDRVLMPTLRGRQLKEYYDRYLAETYGVASGELGLTKEAAATWLSVHPFVSAIVAQTQSETDPSSSQERLSEEQFQRCKELLRRFREGSANEEFRRLLGDIEQEFEGYNGLTAIEALERMRSTPAVKQNRSREKPTRKSRRRT